MHTSIQVFVIKFLVIFCKFNSKVFIYLFIYHLNKKVVFFLNNENQFFYFIKTIEIVQTTLIFYLTPAKL